MPRSDKEILQSAWAVKTHYGEQATAHVRRRIQELREGEDEAGAVIWERIAVALYAIENEQQSQGSH